MVVQSLIFIFFVCVLFFVLFVGFLFLYCNVHFIFVTKATCEDASFASASSLVQSIPVSFHLKQTVTTKIIIELSLLKKLNGEYRIVNRFCYNTCGSKLGKKMCLMSSSLEIVSTT